MEAFTIQNLTFTYPKQDTPVLKNININIPCGAFIVLCGKSGCGKSTLLRQLKTVLAPHGKKTGRILYHQTPLESVDRRIQAEKIGYVLQAPEQQIVTDKVWHELAFGLESLGYDTPFIRRRVAEMASFFGIQTWFHKKVSELSGGQKQLLNLAAVMAMQPDVLILDEPTSQLDPIAATDFFETIYKINKELGVTVILTEHRLEDVFSMSDRVIVMDEGEVIADDTPSRVGALLKNLNHPMFCSMPTPVSIYAAVDNELECPITVREGRLWLDKLSRIRPIRKLENSHNSKSYSKPSIAMEDIWFRYEKNTQDVLKGLAMKVKQGEWYAVVGGNGTGKSTFLLTLAGVYMPYRGKVKRNGKIGVVPQNPQTLFVGNTVEEDLYEILSDRKMSQIEQKEKIKEISVLCEIDELLYRHPYDLSGGEQQRAALAKVLLLSPDILLLDEPTKGLDGYFKLKLGSILQQLQMQGTTIIMVSHDLEFCARYADRCGMFFDGSIVTEDLTRSFFMGNSFYTTEANRMARHLIPEAVTPEDVIRACGGKVPSMPQVKVDRVKVNTHPPNEPLERVSTKHCVTKLNQRSMIATLMVLLAIPLTIWGGIYYLEDRQYYFISLMIMIETLIPFMMAFERRKPQARELVVLAVLCAIGVAGRAAFFMLPQFKPVAAIIIITGVCFGAEAGFLTGAMTSFVSNLFMGQGPWTPWQMFSFGLIGFFAGVLVQRGLLLKSKKALCLYGGISVFFIYGGLMNPASVLMFQSQPTKEMFLMAYIKGIPFDLVHAGATVLFLYWIATPMIEKLERIKIKYGLIQKS